MLVEADEPRAFHELIPQVTYMFTIHHWLTLCIRYISCENKFVERLVCLKPVQTLWLVSFFSFENSAGSSRASSWWEHQSSLLTSFLRLWQFSILSIFTLTHLLGVTCYLTPWLSSFALGTLCTGQRLLEHKNRCVPGWKMNWCWHVCPGGRLRDLMSYHMWRNSEILIGKALWELKW